MQYGKLKINKAMKHKSILILLSFLIVFYPKANAEPAFPGQINM